MSFLFPFQGLMTDTDIINNKVVEDAKDYITDKEFIYNEVQNFKQSKRYYWMVTGEKYYLGEQDILNTPRTVIGPSGELIVAKNLADNRIVDNQYSKIVDQKSNYQLGRPFSVEAENDTYQEYINDILDNKFKRTLKSIMTSSINGGVSWLYVFYNKFGELSFKKIPNYEIIPFYNDEDETILEYAIRIYEVVEYQGGNQVVVEKVEVYSNTGIDYYVVYNGTLIKDVTKEKSSYFGVKGVDENGDEFIQEYNWERVPLIPFRFNASEMPLIKRCKSLQDAINTMLSTFQNNMQEDSRNTLLVLYNYDGQDLGELRKQISEYGIIKIRTKQEGGVDTLQVEVNAANYESILKVMKQALIENGRAFDAKDNRMSGNPNQMTIQAMYTDIELDANGIETEFQASFEELKWFLDTHAYNYGYGDFKNDKFEIIFNRDMLMNETEIIDGLVKSGLITLSQETLVSQHPLVKNPTQEMELIEKEKSDAGNASNPYLETFQSGQG